MTKLEFLKNVSPEFLLSVFGGIASIVSLYISDKSAKSRLAHVIYSLVLTAVVGTSMLYVKGLQSKLATTESRQQQAKVILSNHDPESSDIGANIEFIFKSAALIEINKNDFPRHYETAKNLMNDALQIIKAPSGIGSPNYLPEKERMRNGARAMQGILAFIAGP